MGRRGGDRWSRSLQVRRQRAERARQSLLAATGLASSGVLLIIAFVLAEGWPALPEIFGLVWDPEEARYGALSLLLGSLAVTAGALLVGGPLGLGLALFLTEAAGPWAGRLFRPLLRAMAGLPSVLYGFAGLAVLVPAIRRLLGGSGFSLLAGALVLGLMILPTVATLVEEAVQALPGAYREGALALGATRWQAVSRLLLPAARSGVIAALVLGLGRALGETMAVLMVTGNVAAPPEGLLEPLRTLTGGIALEMGYATGRHRQALFAAGLLLLAAVMIINQVARRAARRAAS